MMSETSDLASNHEAHIRNCCQRTYVSQANHCISERSEASYPDYTLYYKWRNAEPVSRHNRSCAIMIEPASKQTPIAKHAYGEGAARRIVGFPLLCSLREQCTRPTRIETHKLAIPSKARMEAAYPQIVNYVVEVHKVLSDVEDAAATLCYGAARFEVLQAVRGSVAQRTYHQHIIPEFV